MATNHNWDSFHLKSLLDPRSTDPTPRVDSVRGSSGIVTAVLAIIKMYQAFTVIGWL